MLADSIILFPKFIGIASHVGIKNFSVTKSMFKIPVDTNYNFHSTQTVKVITIAVNGIGR